MRTLNRRLAQPAKVLSSETPPPSKPTLTLTVSVLGLQLAAVKLDLDGAVCPSPGPVDQIVKGISKWWSERMTS